jgi:hypothetical protein
MPKEQIPRLKAKSDWVAADFLAEMRGEEVVNPDWLAKRAEVLADADLESDIEETDPNRMTSEQFLKRLQGDNR